MILDAPFPPDIRVEKEAVTLGKAGHEVFVLSQGRKSYPEKENKGYYSVVRFDDAKYKLLNQLTRDFKKFTFFDPVWKKGIDSFVFKYHINVLHVHDLPLVKTAYRVAQKYKIPIVADYHENFPAHIQATAKSEIKWKEKFYRSYKRWTRYEEDISEKVDRIIVVADEYKQHLVSEHGIFPEKITIVQNTIDLERVHSNNNNYQSTNSDFLISYIGSFGPHRGLDIVIKAMPQILSYIPNAKFVIIGHGKNKNELERMIKELNLKDSVKFYDWMKYSNLIKEFKKASIGVIPHHASEHTDNTIPNKVFEYMYFKVPVIVSDRPPLQRIIKETKCGKIFKTGDSADFVKKVLEIHQNPSNYGEMGNRSVIEKYNWQVDGNQLVNLYKSFESNSSVVQ